MKHILVLLTKTRISLRQHLRYRFGLVLIAAVALSACAGPPPPPPPQIDSIEESLRIKSISVVVEKDERAAFPFLPPPELIGLTDQMIVSDFSSALRREIIPASQQGQRPVNVKIRITNLSLRGPITKGGFVGIPVRYTAVYAYLDVTDEVSGEKLIDNERVIVQDTVVTGFGFRWKPQGHHVRSYKILLDIFPLEVKRRLIK